MSRLGILLGLALSLAIHAALLMARESPEYLPSPIDVVDVMPVPPEFADPAPKPQRAPADAETPKPKPMAPRKADAVPTLLRMHKAPATEVESEGDFAGEADGQAMPELRIDWGRAAIHRVLDAGQMKLVVLDLNSKAFTGEVRHGGNGWQFAATDSRSPLRYSNRLRIVHDVPAFKAVRQAVPLAAQQRLAVLVPESLERNIELAQADASRRAGLAMADVRYVGGRFELESGRLHFVITHLQPRGLDP